MLNSGLVTYDWGMNSTKDEIFLAIDEKEDSM